MTEPIVMTPATLLRIIRELDNPAGTDIAYLDVMRWNAARRDIGGETDDEATAILRQLAREKLGSFSVEEIGAAVLQEIDTRG